MRLWRRYDPLEVCVCGHERILHVRSRGFCYATCLSTPPSPGLFCGCASFRREK